MDKKVKVTAEDISNVISIILKRVGGIPVKKYSVDLISVLHVEEIKGIPNEDDYIVHGYEFTREEYKKIKDYVYQQNIISTIGRTYASDGRQRQTPPQKDVVRAGDAYHRLPASAGQPA